MMAACGVGAFAIALLAAGASPPQSPPAPQTATGQSAPATHREEVVVTATRLEQLVKDVPAAVTIVTREDIRRSGATTVDEVLRMVAGFSQLRQASSHASHPTTRSAAVRGLGGSTNSRTLVLLDGVPLNEPFAGAVLEPRTGREHRADRDRQERRFGCVGQPRAWRRDPHHHEEPGDLGTRGRRDG